jgi:hypothetical protein
MSETVQTSMNMVGAISVTEQELLKLPMPELINPNPLDNKAKLPHERFFSQK